VVEQSPAVISGVGRPTPTPPFQRPLLAWLATRLALLAAFAGCVGVLCLSAVRGSANGMFISSIGVFSLIVIPMLRMAGGRNI
jgi:hypothetical protein